MDRFYSAEQVSRPADHTFAYIQVSEADHILTVTLNRPEKRNALNPVMVNELTYALAYGRYNKDVWIVVLKANGKVWCAGADLKAFMGATEEHESTIPEPKTNVTIGDAFKSLHKPCIAVVGESVYAGGFLLLGGCTHVVAEQHCKFGLPEVKRGIWPMQVMAGLLELMPGRKVLDICMRGAVLSAEEAADARIVTDLVATGKAEERAKEIMEEIRQGSPSAIRAGIKAFHEYQQKSSSEHHSYLQGALMQLMQTADAREGIMAFREKREPQWSGE